MINIIIREKCHEIRKRIVRGTYLLAGINSDPFRFRYFIFIFNTKATFQRLRTMPYLINSSKVLLES